VDIERILDTVTSGIDQDGFVVDRQLEQLIGSSHWGDYNPIENPDLRIRIDAPPIDAEALSNARSRFERLFGCSWPEPLDRLYSRTDGLSVEVVDESGEWVAARPVFFSLREVWSNAVTWDDASKPPPRDFIFQDYVTKVHGLLHGDHNIAHLVPLWSPDTPDGPVLVDCLYVAPPYEEFPVVLRGMDCYRSDIQRRHSILAQDVDEWLERIFDAGLSRDDIAYEDHGSVDWVVDEQALREQ
jgi:hypothetical protein